MLFTADGETGKAHGNETIRVTPDGVVSVKIPAGLVPQGGATHLTLDASIDLGSQDGRLGVWADRIAAHQAVRYDITHDPETGRWYLDVSCKNPSPGNLPTPQALAGLRKLGVDLNEGHLAGWVVDGTGIPVGPPLTVPLELAGLPASARDARLREAISTLIRYAQAHGCASIAVEDLNFADAKSTGRETMGRGRRGRRSRRTVAGIPTGRFRDRLTECA